MESYPDHQPQQLETSKPADQPGGANITRPTPRIFSWCSHPAICLLRGSSSDGDSTSTVKITNKEQSKRETKKNLKDKLSDFISDEEDTKVHS